MKKALLFFFGLVLATIAIAQNKVVNDENVVVRQIDKNFNAIEISTGIQLLFSQGDQRVAVSASNVEDRDRIITEVSNGVLRIYYDSKMFPQGSKGRNLRVYVSAPEIKMIEGASGAHITIDGSLSGSDLTLKLSSGSNFKGSIKTTKTVVQQSSGANSSISGSGNELVVKTSSGARFKGYNFEVQNCNAEASSGGSIETNVTSALTASASSGGHIRYKGNGGIVRISTSSGGNVKKAN